MSPAILIPINPLNQPKIKPINERSVNWYLKPLLKWLDEEWEIFRFRLYRLIRDEAKRVDKKEKEISEIVEFEGKERLAILVMMDQSIGVIKSELAKRAKEQTKIAKRDSSNRIGHKADDLEVLLSQEGLEQIVENFDSQKEQFEETTGSLRKRIDRILQIRYGSPEVLSNQVSHTLRIEKGVIVARNTEIIENIATSYRLGNTSSERFRERMLERLGIVYRKAFRAGKGTPLSQEDLEFLKVQVAAQEEYLDNLILAVEAERVSQDKISRRVNQRASLFGKRAQALYEAGWLTNLPDDTLVNWVLGIAEHCETCPAYSRNSPYLKSTLPGLPAEGFSVTRCGTNCKCRLEMNELSTAELDILA